MLNRLINLLITAFLFVLTSGQNVLSCPNNNNEIDVGVQKVAAVNDPTAIFPVDVMKIIMRYASEETYPGDMAAVNRRWRHIMREGADFLPTQNGIISWFNKMFHRLMVKNESNQLDLFLSRVNPFMRECMDIWLPFETLRRFRTAVLRIKRPTREVVDIDFSTLVDPLKGTLDLSGCGPLNDHWAMSTDIDRLCVFSDQDGGKSFFLFAPLSEVAQHLHTTAKPLVVLMDRFYINDRTIGIFGRWNRPLDVYWSVERNPGSSPMFAICDLYSPWSARVRGEVFHGLPPQTREGKYMIILEASF